MRYILALLSLAFLAGTVSAADVKPLVINPSTGLQQQLQAGTGLTVSASTTASTALYVQPGVAPTSPLDGYFWSTSAGFFGRVAGVTVGPFGAGGGTVPTGTGFPHITAGAQDPAARAVNVASADITGVTPSANGGTGVNNAGTFTNATNSTITGGGTLALGGFTLTVPATDTADVLGTAQTFTAKKTFATASTSIASMTLPHGVAPTAPVNGDLWTTTAGFFGRVNGATVGPFGAGGGITGTLTSGQIPLATGTSTVGNSHVADNGTTVTIAGLTAMDKGTGTAVISAGNVPIGAVLGVAGGPACFDVYGYGNSIANLRTYSAAGTRAAPTTVGSLNSLTTWTGGGYIGSPTNGYVDTSEWSAVSGSSAWSSTNAPTDMRLRLCPAGSVTLAAVFYVKSTGNVLIGPSGTDVAGVNGLSVAGETYTSASTTTSAGLNIAPGVAPTTPANGDVWQDSTSHALINRQQGASLPLVGMFCTTIADGAAVNTTTETSLFGTLSGTKTLPANFFTVGKTIRVVVRGTIQATATPQLVLKVKLGSTVLTLTAGTVSLTAFSTNSFEISSTLTCRTTGATGTVQATGFAHIAVGTTQGQGYILGMPNGSATTIDTTATQVVDATATWNTANALNNMVGQVCTVEALN